MPRLITRSCHTRPSRPRPWFPSCPTRIPDLRKIPPRPPQLMPRRRNLLPMQKAHGRRRIPHGELQVCRFGHSTTRRPPRCSLQLLSKSILEPPTRDCMPPSRRSPIRIANSRRHIHSRNTCRARCHSRAPTPKRNTKTCCRQP